MIRPGFHERVCQWTPEQLAPYAGKHIVWAPDGEKILAAAPTREELYREVDRLGITDCVEDYIPGSGDEVMLGGLW
jgi:hypothetical protein